MSFTVSIIGSFRKPDHYDVVKNAIALFKKSGLVVLSPKGAKVCNSIDDFVIFESDDSALTPAEIQMITLNRIIHSNAVYVCNVNGYLGRTTCYEIGFCLSRNVPLYFLSPPLDLPIPVDQDHILSIEEFSVLASEGRTTRFHLAEMGQAMQKAINSIWPELNENKTAVGQKRLMICGSMVFYNRMKQFQSCLSAQGIDAVIPKDEGTLPASVDEKTFFQFKKRVSNSYLKKIRDSSTEAILVFNEEKNGIKNYIGANTFVEIAMAFAWNRTIYLLNDYYEPFRDELLAWECRCLNGNLYTLIENWFESPPSDNPNVSFDQLALF